MCLLHLCFNPLCPQCKMMLRQLRLEKRCAFSSAAGQTRKTLRVFLVEIKLRFISHYTSKWGVTQHGKTERNLNHLNSLFSGRIFDQDGFDPFHAQHPLSHGWLFNHTYIISTAGSFARLFNPLPCVRNPSSSKQTAPKNFRSRLNCSLFHSLLHFSL